MGNNKNKQPPALQGLRRGEIMKIGLPWISAVEMVKEDFDILQPGHGLDKASVYLSI